MKQIDIKTISASLVLAFAVAGPIQAQDKPTPMDKAVEARQAVMKLYSFNLGLLSAMAKGDAEYDAETAINAAWNINATALMKNGPMWPPGSDNKSYTNTRALPAAWENFPLVSQRHGALTKASEELVAVAGNGLKAMRSELGNVGKACKACHDDFRAKKK